MADTSFIPGPDTVRAYRDALGSFATGVTVVTVATPNGPLAITVNSFTSVSLTPPLLLWCPAHSSLRHDIFVAAEYFAIHVMAEDQLPLAKHFALSGDDFSAASWQPNSDGAPALDGVIARFDCHRHAVHPAGDHSIIIGEVKNVSSRPGKGLIFKRGLYGGFLEQS